MELTHRFTVPAGVEETWTALNDIESVAGCFPGAKVTSVEADSFQGSVKVKLGPIALVYNGSGEFTEKDDAAHRMVLKAKGKDKRGNGTAGADVVATLASAGDGATDVEVVTDLSITGKPAQFGRGVIQDVSDKLLGQFVTCLEQRLGAPEAAPAPSDTGAASVGASGDEEDQDAGPASMPTGAAARPEPSGDQDAGPASVPQSAVRPSVRVTATEPEDDDSLDLGAALLPVLLKSYGKQAAAGLGVLLLILLVLRRRRP